ncbi:polyprotein [Phytophthora megakarya]|uniref:Polyprotein n=1 Tax=Phytophthora megakarya TaxID=4795 RepID=A0A225VAN0_9STRA|nr:polyprotein [Phytophthora megakarya]
MPGTGAIYQPQWRLSPDQERALREWIKEMLRAALIRPSISPHGAPTFCIKKAVEWRVVHDYRAMNAKTVRQSTPMPIKDAIFDRMSTSLWYSCFDLLPGYSQMRMRTKDIPYTAFQTPDGLFEYIAVPMGLNNAPATFNRIVQRIFEEMRECVATYFDAIYVFTKTNNVEEHVAAVRRVFERCREKKLYLKLSKSIICAEEISCLGDFVGRQGVRIDPDKVRVVREWPLPRTIRNLQSFLGPTVYVQRFCQLFSEISAPLFEMVKRKDRKQLEWTPERVRAFEALKTALSQTPVLALPDFTKPFLLRTDASQFAVGGVLLQTIRSSDGTQDTEKPIAYCGRKMNSAELNYPTHEQEMLVISLPARWRLHGRDGSSLAREGTHPEDNKQKNLSLNFNYNFDTFLAQRTSSQTLRAAARSSRSTS